jgi:hypothetical protein
MLFANALTYNIAFPDSSLCTQHTDMDACLNEPSAFSKSSMCWWNAETSTCHFNEPSNNIQQVVFVAVIAAIASTPLAIFADYIIMDFICAKTKPVSTALKSGPPIRPLQKRLDSFTSSVRNVDVSSAALDDISALSRELREFRCGLSDSDRVAFDGMILYFLFFLSCANHNFPHLQICGVWTNLVILWDKAAVNPS